jgi:hypothetical protein
LNKKRAALRRGIRDLIADTTRDLAAFEGREPEPRRPPESSPPQGEAQSGQADLRPPTLSREIPGLNGSPSSPGGEHHGTNHAAGGAAGAAAETAPDRAAPAVIPFELVTEDVLFPPPAPAAGDGPSAPSPRPAAPDRTSRSVKSESRHAKRPRRLSGESRRARRAGRDTRAASAKTQRGGKAPAADNVRKAAESARRPAPLGADDVGAGPEGPAQAESRTGVCRSYFVNHECWRVPTAYCNTALQVCVIRQCPVYHLHKDALERRFAKKYKHLW